MPAVRICEYAWSLYDQYDKLSHGRTPARPSDLRLAWVNYKAHRASCPQCDPISRQDESGEFVTTEVR